MNRRAPLPEPFDSVPFLARDVTPGIASRSRLYAADLDRSVWGTRLRASELTVVDRCALFQKRLHGQSFFSHATAAQLWGIPLPWWLERDPTIHVASPSPSRAPHATGLRGHKLIVAADEVVVRHGIRLTNPARTWVDLATMLAVPDLVAAGDHIAHWRNPSATIPELTRAYERRVGRRASRILAEALPLLDDRSESPPESVLRVLLIRAGFAPPRVNHVVTDRFGEFVARTDLLLEEENLVLEYMGDYHRTSPGQWRSDMTRRSRIETQGRRVMEINADDLRDPDELVARIRARAAQRS